MLAYQIDWSETMQGIFLAFLSALGAYNFKKAHGAVRPETKLSLDGNGNKEELARALQVLYQFKEDMYRENAIQNERLAAMETALKILLNPPVPPWSTGRGPYPRRPDKPD